MMPVIFRIKMPIPPKATRIASTVITRLSPGTEWAIAAKIAATTAKTMSIKTLVLTKLGRCGG